MSFLVNLFDITRKDLKRMWPIVARISALEPQTQALSDAQLRAKTEEFRQRLAEGETLDQLLPEAFAVVREAMVRVIGHRPYDVQLIGGMVLHEGKVAEMKTGEGKTYVANFALYLNALTGRGCHLITHNDYLVRRDCEWMGPVHQFLGLDTRYIQAGMDNEPRRAAYQADITYGTIAEFGFDYLRDNMRLELGEVVQRSHHFAVVDEADSLIIDEARVPLILSGPGSKPTGLYQRVDRVIKQLQRESDYMVDEKTKSALLTEQGTSKLERLLGVGNISDSEHAEIYQHVHAALRANACYHLDVDYVVKDGQVIIVDEFTGRLMFGRRYSEGLHQAIEAKEGVKVEREYQTVATISIQNYIRLYEKIAGMTGTAKTEEQEFIKIYGMPVVVIPTNRPMIRMDHSDVVYRTEEAKFRGILGELLRLKSRGEPVLVGTRSIEVSERLSQRLQGEQLQLFCRLAVLHNALGSHDGKISPALANEIRHALGERLTQARREKKHLEQAVDQIELHPTQLAHPEELKQLEQRLKRVTDLENSLEGVLGKLENGALGPGDMRRVADLITYQPMDEVKQTRLPALMTACGLDPDILHQDNLPLICQAIGLEEENASRMAELMQRGIPHQVLNAKYHEQEALIIANAGRSDALTIATNMAGRGVDILLGGNPTRLAQDRLAAQAEAEPASQQLQAALEQARGECEADRQNVLALGGLFILGTERHESRRIDNQLRGRAGRQGDPGASRFFLSLNDELWRLFGPERVDFLLNISKWDECEPIEHSLLSKAIENAQKKVEAHNFSMRQHLLQYDDVKNLHREVIYGQRRKVLEGADLRESVLDALRQVVQQRVDEFASSQTNPEAWDLKALHLALNEIMPLQLYSRPQDLEGKQREELEEHLQQVALAAYEDREQELTPETMRMLERLVMLRVIDTRWVEHLDAVDFLEEGIGLRGYAGVDPLVAFRKEAYLLWESLLSSIREELCRLMFRVQLVEEKQQESPYKHVVAGGDQEQAGPPEPARAAAKVGRNDPCPCGSGRKYKKCCMGK